ncbi:hypothetical protein YW3DRAFT_00155 [Streptomyces sp. MnatMP-M77]|uniref:hypothetical protein n=1 Tax=Streptomyces TaxID=1883 RepID=UPI0008052977|nr:hypothetical protein [Streptomyces sp. MnatMP-M77]MYT76863.1 hypothetical protein [Streptomyces sp. SID8364]NEB53816.1 hypothetical protein [Streptomyces griseus]SBU88308.1 hypothetical protein YW3DRAFT_00155 [Streptomyces sp. MnatMP-M77]
MKAALAAPGRARVLDYVAAVTVKADGQNLPLGGVALPNRRLVLRWLRRQALRLADGHGRDPVEAAAWHGARDVLPVTFHGADAPEALRAWAGDHGSQEHAMSALASGLPALLTVVDPFVGLRVTLGAWPVDLCGWATAAAPANHPYPPRTEGS